MRTAGSSSWGNRIRSNRADQTDPALFLQSPQGDEAVDLWLGAEMEQEANRKVRRSEVVMELACRARRQGWGRRGFHNQLFVNDPPGLRAIPQHRAACRVPYHLHSADAISVAQLAASPRMADPPHPSHPTHPSSRLRRILVNETFASVDQVLLAPLPSTRNRPYHTVRDMFTTSKYDWIFPSRNALRRSSTG